MSDIQKKPYPKVKQVFSPHRLSIRYIVHCTLYTIFLYTFSAQPGFLVAEDTGPQQQEQPQYRLFTIDVPVPLATMDRNTAENQCAVLQAALRRVPELSAFQQGFESQARFAVVDRFGANSRGERYIRSNNGKCTTTVFGCEVHKAAGAMKRSLFPADNTISGVVNCGLAQEGSGALQTLRQILQSIFEESLRIVYGSPPQGRPLAHRKAVMEMFLPLSDSSQTLHPDQSFKLRNRKRRFILSYFANSDLESFNIIHFCGFQCCDSPESTLYHFQRYVTWALLPRKLGVLSRKSWTGSSPSFEWSGLLESHWYLMQRVITRYVGKPQRQLQQRPPMTGDDDNHDDADTDTAIPAMQLDPCQVSWITKQYNFETENEPDHYEGAIQYQYRC